MPRFPSLCSAALAVALASPLVAQDRSALTNPVIGMLFDTICEAPESCVLEEAQSDATGTRFAFSYAGEAQDIPISFRRIAVDHSAARSALFPLFPETLAAEATGLTLRNLPGNEAAAGFINLILASNATATLSYDLTDPDGIGWLGAADLSSGDRIEIDLKLTVSDMARSMVGAPIEDAEQQTGMFFAAHIFSNIESARLSLRETALFDLMHLPWQIQYGDRLDQTYADAIDFLQALPTAPAEYTPDFGAPVQVTGDTIAQARDNLVASIGFLRDWTATDHGLELSLTPGSDAPLPVLQLLAAIPNLSFVAILTRLGERLDGGSSRHFLLNAADALDTDFLWDLVVAEAASIQTSGGRLVYVAN